MPNIIEDKKKILFDAVSKDYNIGTFDEFSKKLEDNSKRKAFYEGVGAEYNLGSYTDFEAKLGVKKKPNQTLHWIYRPGLMQVVRSLKVLVILFLRKYLK
jgi:hypothetical protein